LPKLNREKPSITLGALWIVLASALLILLAAVVKHLDGAVPTAVLIFFEAALSLVILCPFISFIKELQQPKHLFLNYFRSFAFVLSSTFYFLALQHLSIMNMSLLDNIKSLVIPIIALFWFKERLTLRMWLAIIFGFVGVWIMIDPTSTGGQLGNLYGLIEMLTAAFALASVRRLSTLQSVKTYLFYTFFFITLITLPSFILYAPHLTLTQLPSLLLIGFLGLGVQLSVIKAYRYASAGQLAPFFYFQLPIAALLDWALFHAIPGWMSLIGGFVIVVSGLAMIYLQRGRYASIE
jgi:drug/metabolite transporter (DMT)-like permease